MSTKMLSALCALAASLAAPAWAEAPRVATIASYPHGAFLENLSVDPDGKLLFTSYIGKTIMAWRGAGEPQALVTLDVHPVAVLARENDIIVSAHGKAFVEGPSFVETNQLLVLDRKGGVIRRVAAPEARFLNGMVEVAPGVILVADSIAAKIWRFDPSSGKLSEWLADPLLGADPAQPSQRPGANGLKLHDGWLYISNSARGALYRLRLKDATPAGALALFRQTGPIDDFTFLADGSIAAATHGAKLIRIAADGAVTDIMATGCDSCTSVTVYGPRRDLVVLTTGDLVEGGTAPARVLSVPSPVH